MKEIYETETERLAKICAIEEQYLRKMPDNHVQQERTRRAREKYFQAVKAK